jgi:adenylyltransferase/sulfurtransferase
MIGSVFWDGGGFWMQHDESPKSGAVTGNRYARQIALSVIGQTGQERLHSACLLIIGCGALGSAQAELAARAGIGTIIIADRDIPELHNLQRQMLFDERDVLERMPKAEAAARRLRAINSEIHIEPVVADVTRDNVLDLVAQADLILDGTDNFETRYLINDACVHESKPWIYGGTLGTCGIIMAVRPGEGPCLRCIFPEPPSTGAHPTCETDGVLNTAVVITAAMQVNMAFRILLGAYFSENCLYSFDLWKAGMRPVTVERDSECVCCSARHFEFLNAVRGSSSTVFCGRNAVQIVPERPVSTDFKELAERLSPLGEISFNGLVLECSIGQHRLIVFPDGRILILGTTDPSEARSLVARYLGV